MQNIGTFAITVQPEVTPTPEAAPNQENNSQQTPSASAIVITPSKVNVENTETPLTFL